MTAKLFSRLGRALMLTAAAGMLSIAPPAGIASARQGYNYINVNFCNKTSQKVYVALSYIREPGSSDWIVEGWKNINAYSCLDFDLAKTGWIYYYAEDDTDGYWGGSDIRLCVEHPGPFRRVNNPNYTCDGSELKGFKGFDPTGQDSRTINFNP